jgi:lysyl-tRNA synthetase class 1
MSINHYQESTAWPFLEAKKILTKIQNKTPKKGFVLFETGYGPSGLPHIGTFGEVVRTAFVMHAFTLLAPNIPIKMYCISDDIDGLRKVPENIPNQQLITKHLGKPLTSVPDPFGTHPSFGHHMNAKLQKFLDSFGFEYTFISATQKYKSGAFNQTMLKVLQKYDELLKLMLPTLGEERKATYSPFMPIDSTTNLVIDKGVIGVNLEKQTITYLDNQQQKQEISVLDGNCKLQWKIDFGARWQTFEVDYEIFGKDHQPNQQIYSEVCKILGGTPPINFVYEMFLSETGEKISKSKGNGIALEDWLKYATTQSMSLFMYQKPQTAKRLYFDIIPKAVDEYLVFMNSFSNQNITQQLENPVFHIHQGKPPLNNVNFPINYSLLLNLASACNPENEDILWGFIAKYAPDINKKTSPLLAEMVQKAITYYHDFVKQNKVYLMPNVSQINQLQALKQHLLQSDCNANSLQNIVYQVGKEQGYADNIGSWFSLLYQMLLGQTQGPRIGSFIALFGVENFGKLIDKAINQQLK